MVSQDGVTPYTANESLEWVTSHFSERAIGRCLSVEWSPHFPHLSPLDVYLFGDLKDNMYKDHARSIFELKQVITEKVRSITLDEC